MSALGRSCIRLFVLGYEHTWFAWTAIVLFFLTGALMRAAFPDAVWPAPLAAIAAGVAGGRWVYQWENSRGQSRSRQTSVDSSRA